MTNVYYILRDFDSYLITTGFTKIKAKGKLSAFYQLVLKFKNPYPIIKTIGEMQRTRNNYGVVVYKNWNEYKFETDIIPTHNGPETDQ